MLIEKEKHIEKTPFDQYIAAYSTRDASFVLNTQQRHMVDTINQNHFVIVKQPRQCGTSTIIAAKIAHTISNAEYNNYSAAILTQSMQSSNELLNKVKYILQSDPKQYYVKKNQRNVLEITRDGYCAKIVCMSTFNIVLDGSIKELYIDNAAFFNDKDATNLYNLVDNLAKHDIYSPKIVIVSTPNGEDNFFWKIWVRSVNGVNRFKPVALHWLLNDWQTRNMRWCKVVEKENGTVYKDVIHNNLNTPDMVIEMLKKGYEPHSDWTDLMYETRCDEMSFKREILAEF